MKKTKIKPIDTTSNNQTQNRTESIGNSNTNVITISSNIKKNHKSQNKYYQDILELALQINENPYKIKPQQEIENYNHYKTI